MRIGILNSNKNIAYGSFNVFYENIKKSLLKFGDTVFEFNTFNELENFIMNNSLDITLSLGKYGFYSANGIEFYNLYGIPHFNWILDNPIKIGIDETSKNVFYIFIDNDFSKLCKLNNTKHLFLPLGSAICENQFYDKEIDIIFTGQVKDSESIYTEIHCLNTTEKNAVKNIIEYNISNLDNSFIDILNENLNSSFRNESLKKIFRISNSYIRSYKRELVLSNINSTNINIYGEVFSSKLLSKKNIKIHNKISYSELNNIVSKSKLSLNITPNFNFSCHDRIINSIALGSCPLTDYNNYLGSKFKDLESIVFYNYKDIYSLDNKISKIIDNKNYIDILNKSNRILKENFTWDKTIEKLRIFFNSKIS